MVEASRDAKVQQDERYHSSRDLLGLSTFSFQHPASHNSNRRGMTLVFPFSNGSDGLMQSSFSFNSGWVDGSCHWRCRDRNKLSIPVGDYHPATSQMWTNLGGNLWGVERLLILHSPLGDILSLQDTCLGYQLLDFYSRS